MGALFVSVVREVADQTVDHEISVATSGTNIRRTILQRVARLFRGLNALEGITPHEASTMLVESLRYALFDGNVGASFSAAKLVSGCGVMIDNAVYEKKVPKEYEELRDGDEPIIKRIIEINDGIEIATTYTACYPKDVGRYSITPAMVVVLSTLMSNSFEEFSNIGDGFERDMAKFLYLTVQVFHGRPLRDLVDFTVGPLAVIGAAAQEILDANTTVNFNSLTLRIAGSLLANCDVRGDVQVEDSLIVDNVGDAWIEISPPYLSNADVVLHIPNVITLPIQCKEIDETFPYQDIAKAMNSMLVESKRWRDPDPTKGRGEHTHPEKTYAEMTDDLDKVFAGAEVLLDRAAAAPNPNIARLQTTTPENGNSKDYGQALCDLDAPVIRILYVSRALTLSSTTMSWDHLNAIGPHCIMAEGIGEYSLNTLPLHLGTASPDAQYTTNRLHRVRKSIMLFESRPKAPTKVVDLAVTSAPLAANEKGFYRDRQCCTFSRKLSSHHSGGRVVAKERIQRNLTTREEIERRERMSLVKDFDISRTTFFNGKEVGW